MKFLTTLLFMLFCFESVFAHPGHDHGTDLLFASAEVRQAESGAETGFESRVSITIGGDYRVIRANGLPNHPTGQFPNRGNPNRIAAQDYSFRVPIHPKVATKPTALGMQPFGVAVNGVVFDPGAAEWWHGDPNSGSQYEPMSGVINLGVDQNNAHVQPNGAYHYHAIPVGLLDELTGGQRKVVLAGWAADGFPIYGPWGCSTANDTNSEIKRLKSSYRIRKGSRPSGPRGEYDGSFVEDYEYVAVAGDLDECNGRYGIMPDFPDGTYYYVLTDGFPFIPRQFKGTPDPSFSRRGPGGRRPGRPTRPPPGGPRPRRKLSVGANPHLPVDQQQILMTAVSNVNHCQPEGPAWSPSF